MKTLVLGVAERRAIEAQAHTIRLTAARLARHVLQDISDVQAARYIADMRELLDAIEQRTGRDR